MKCEHCEIISRKSKAEVLYEDKDIVVAIKDLVTTPGQITVFPKEHFTILEMVPDDILKKCSVVANKVGAAVFESLGSQGTNILVNNGLGAGQKVPHFAIEIIPRQEGDGLNFQWQSKQLMEDEMELVTNLIKEGLEKDDQKEVPEESEETVTDENGEENYLLKSLRRIP